MKLLGCVCIILGDIVYIIIGLCGGNSCDGFCLCSCGGCDCSGCGVSGGFLMILWEFLWIFNGVGFGFKIFFDFGDLLFIEFILWEEYI